MTGVVVFRNDIQYVLGGATQMGESTWSDVAQRGIAGSTLPVFMQCKQCRNCYTTLSNNIGRKITLQI
jgi:hypothetical protein